MLDFQLAQAPLRLGVAEGTDPHHVPFGTLVTAENVCWTKSGRLEKRLGTTPITQNISGGGTISAAKRLLVRGTELGLVTGDTLYSYAGGSWVSRGRVPEVGITWTTLQDNMQSARTSDIAYLSDGRIVQAWCTGDPTDQLNTSNLYYQIIDAATGAVLVPPTFIDSPTGYFIRVIASGTTWLIIWRSGTVLNAFGGGATTVLATGLSSIGFGTAAATFDACVLGLSFAIAYQINAGGIGLARWSLASTPVSQATGSVTGETGFYTSISIAGAVGETLYIGYYLAGTGSFRIAGANPSTLVQTFAPVTLSTPGGSPTYTTVGVCRRDATSCLYLCSHDGSNDTTGHLQSFSITSGGVSTSGRLTRFQRLTSRPFALGGRFYACVTMYWDANSFNSTATSIPGTDSFVIDVTADGLAKPHREVGKVDVLVGTAWCSGYVSSPTVVSATRVLVGSPMLSRQATNLSGLRNGVRLLSLTLGADLPADMWRSITVGQEALIAGGVLSVYDGASVIGYGWAHAPFIDTASTVAFASGGSIATGTYLYNVVAERRSAAGVLYRSPTGLGYAKAVTGPSGSVNVFVAPVSLSRAESGVMDNGIYALFRSIAGGSIPQRLTLEPLYNVILNTVAPPFSVLDTKNDTGIGGAGESLANQAAIYTTGGELDDHQPPSCLTHTWHANRIWVLAGDGRTVWVSKDSTANLGTAPGFHPTQVLVFDRKITSLCPMDEKLIAFSADSFWYVIGQGPAPNGQNADYVIAPVQTDVGCTNPRSIVATPDGLMFLSRRGIYLLGRGLELSWIGRPVKDELAAYPNVTSAVLVASRNEVRFTCNNLAGDGGIVLVWNYVEKQWTWSKYTVGGVYGAPIADAVMWNGVWTFVTPGGVVSTETEATNLDGSTWVPLVIETAWVNAGGPLSFQSVRHFEVEGISNTDHDLTLSVGFNSDPSYPQTRTFAAGSTVTSPGPFEACTITIGTRRKCQAIRFKIQDATPSGGVIGIGKGPSFDTIGIEVGSKKGFRPKPAAQIG